MEGPPWATPVVSLSSLLLPLLLPSQIDELYEAYCVQRRLRDGAYNMVRAYSTGSPGSREARDSLAEATRGHREYTEVRDKDHCGRGKVWAHERELGLHSLTFLPLLPRACVFWRMSWRPSWASFISG